MKKYFSLLLTAVLLLTGCTDDFSGIFDGTDKDLIYPINHLENNIPEDLFDNSENFHQDMVLQLAQDVWGDASDSPSKNIAHVINDAAILRDYVTEDKVYKWPEIDFNKYSLVLSKYNIPHGGFYVSEQRAKASKNSIDIYIKLSLYTGVHDMWARAQYHISLFPKMKTGPANLHAYYEYN